jgi:hypothetical protein
LNETNREVHSKVLLLFNNKENDLNDKRRIVDGNYPWVIDDECYID